MDETASVKTSSQVGSSISNGTKRKRSQDPKFYAVRVGHKPGVYTTWNDCLDQVTGFKKALYKSFPNYSDAERFVAGENPTLGADQGSVTKFYAVKNGRVPGIYTDWTTASEQIKGWSRPKHHSFPTRAEAQRYLDLETPKTEGQSDTQSIDGNTFFMSKPIDASPYQTNPSIPTKKRRSQTNAKSKLNYSEYNEEEYEAGFGPLPLGAVDGFDPNIKLDEKGDLVYKSREERQATKLVPSEVDQTGPIRIHTDGSSIGNGQQGACAGVGVYFGPGDGRNISERLAGLRQTNQRAELTAVQRAIEHVPRNRDVSIVTDSKYAIDCLTDWFQNWRRNGWKTSTGKAVENRDLIENILSKIEERERLRVRTNFEWVKGHAATEGNIEADKLAVNGAKKAVSR